MAFFYCLGSCQQLWLGVWVEIGGIEIFWKTSGGTNCFEGLQEGPRKHFELFYLKYVCQYYGHNGEGVYEMFHALKGEMQILSTCLRGVAVKIFTIMEISNQPTPPCSNC